MIVLKLYNGLLTEVDAIDNGVEQGDVKYRITTGLGSRVKRLNGSWQQEISQAEENLNFRKAMVLCGTEFQQQVDGILLEWWPARKIVEEALEAGGEYIVLPTCCPWQEHLLDIEQEKRLNPVLYVIFPDSRSGSFRIQAVPKEKGSFTNRKPLPEAWRGVRDSELSAIAAIDGCVFCHASGFIGGNLTKDGAILMAQKAILL